MMRLLFVAIFGLGVSGNALSQAVMTQELMERMIARTLGSTQVVDLMGNYTSAFGLSPTGEKLPAKGMQLITADGRYVFAVVLDREPTDIVIIFYPKFGDTNYGYLTNKTGVLRATSFPDQPGSTPEIMNEKVAEKFREALAEFAKVAATLPPTR